MELILHLGKHIGHTAVRHRHVSIVVVTTAMFIVDGTLSDFTRVIRLERSSFDVIIDQYYRGRNTVPNTHLNLNS